MRMRGRPMGKPQDTKKTLARLIKYLAEDKATLIMVAFFVVISSLSGIAGNYLLKPIINDHIKPLIGTNPTSQQLGGLIGMLVAMALVYIAGALCSYAYQYKMMHLANKTLNRIRVDLFNKMQDLPIAYFDKHTRYVNK